VFAESKARITTKRPVIADRIAPTEKNLFTPTVIKRAFAPRGPQGGTEA
jgi:hypothetical protein